MVTIYATASIYAISTGSILKLIFPVVVVMGSLVSYTIDSLLAVNGDIEKFALKKLAAIDATSLIHKDVGDYQLRDTKCSSFTCTLSVPNYLGGVKKHVRELKCYNGWGLESYVLFGITSSGRLEMINNTIPYANSLATLVDGLSGEFSQN
jgi:hypothetical protein